MKNFLYLFVLSLALLTSCKTPQNIAYLQDVKERVPIKTQDDGYIRFMPGDKLSIFVHSRILVMSHDLPSVFDMVKIRSDIKGGLGGEKKFFELENKKIKEQTVRNEYQKLLKHVYEYANNRGPDDMDDTSEMSIGNIMRRLMEAFASFCYNTGFEKMMCNAGVLDSIDPIKRPYYENFMCRLTLNGESHEEEHVYSLNTMTRYFSKDEKVQTAKSLLLFLLYINEEHMKSYFEYEKNPAVINTILSWQTEEANWLIGAAAGT